LRLYTRRSCNRMASRSDETQHLASLQLAGASRSAETQDVASLQLARNFLISRHFLNPYQFSKTNPDHA
jgi:hypothetical protein